MSVMSLAGDWLSMRLRIGPVGIRGQERERQTERRRTKVIVRDGEDGLLCGGLYLQGDRVNDLREEVTEKRTCSSRQVTERKRQL